MKRSILHITPLRLAIAYLLVVIIILIKKNTAPSVEGWALTFATGILTFAIAILGIERLLIVYIKNIRAYWIMQFILFAALVWLFINEGLPGRL